MSTYTREDVERSYHQGHHGDPMVNVKVYDGPDDGFRTFTKENPDADPRFTLDWIEENCSDEHLGDVDEWDAVALAKWRKFERFARATAAHIMADVIDSIYVNEFCWALDEEAERERAANQDIATVADHG
jgi:hypothetical protein